MDDNQVDLTIAYVAGAHDRKVLIVEIKRLREAIAKARNDALEEAALACERQAQVFSDPSYAGPNPLDSFNERFACMECAEAIRALKTEEGR